MICSLKRKFVEKGNTSTYGLHKNPKADKRQIIQVQKIKPIKDQLNCYKNISDLLIAVYNLGYLL